MTARPVALVLRCEADDCRAVADELRACGFETIEPASIEAGLALLADGTIDAAFCDACELDSGGRPVWQRALASAARRETLVVLLGRANSHQEMLASGPDSRLVICPTNEEGVASGRTREILRRTGLVASAHSAESLDSPHFAESRLIATADAS